MLDQTKTKAMLDLEARHGGAPVERILADAINRTGSVGRAAAELGLPHSTVRMWCWRFGLRFVRPSVTVVLPEERAS